MSKSTDLINSQKFASTRSFSNLGFTSNPKFSEKFKSTRSFRNLSGENIPKPVEFHHEILLTDITVVEDEATNHKFISNLKTKNSYKNNFKPTGGIINKSRF